MFKSSRAIALGPVFEVAGTAPQPQSSMLDVDFAQISDVGRVRDHNEDYCGYVLPSTEEQARSLGWLFAVADGVGGHEHGEVASREAVENLLQGFREAPGGSLYSSLLPRLIQSANAHVFKTGHEKTQAGSSMATTIVACALRYDRAAVAHVGDSRCYL